MARTDNFTNWATDVADSIREMTGKTGLIPAANFDTEIKSIETSEDLTEELNTYSDELGEQTISLNDLSSLLDNKMLPSGSSSVLPSEYTRLLYIESTGTQYITTDVIPSNLLGFEIDFLTKNSIGSSNGTFGTIFGNRTSYITNGYQLTTYSENANTKRGHLLFGTITGIADQIRYDAGIIPNQRGTIKFNNRVLRKANEEELTISLNITINSSLSSYIRIFCLMDGSTLSEYSKTQLYDLKFTYAGTPFRHYVPVLRKSDNVVGLYEMFTGTFYTNNGTGTFLYETIE